MLIDRRKPAAIAEDPIVRQALYLIQHGIPFDVAWSLRPAQAKAWGVVICEQNSGKKFNWDRDEWPQDPPPGR